MDRADMELLIMEMIVDAGSARSYAMQAIASAKDGSLNEALNYLEEANGELAKAHLTQTDLIHKVAGGETVEVDLFMVHAQNHLMTAMLARDMAYEFVDLYRKRGESAGA
ncbi:MAG: PTS lactose/cellobiose transporter subunit IIA [Oscillospiraceae bacterium]|jgi:PTS system cellobiose-specific IIA component|nr:PTS lactose/cellobiose transporter subunit IIA [Oscillospiraceae bacterium]